MTPQIEQMPRWQRVLINLVWLRIPATLPRRWSVLRVIMLDGMYLRAWTMLASIGPSAALLIGFFIGWRPLSDTETYTSSLFGMCVLVALGSVGSALGVWALLGYMIGDLLLRVHSPFFTGTVLTRFVHVIVPLFISYLLLGSILVLAPLVCPRLGRQMVLSLRLGFARITGFAAAVCAFVAGGLAWAWTHSVPTLIRPVYTWSGTQPPTSAIAPLQQDGSILVGVAMVVTAVRVIGEDYASRRRGYTAMVIPIVGAPSGRSRALSLSIRTAVTTLMMAGLFTSWWHAGLFTAIFAGALIVSTLLPTHAPVWTRFVNRLPLVLRLFVGVAISYLAARVLISAAWTSTDTFLPVLIGTATSFLVLALLVPRQLART